MSCVSSSGSASATRTGTWPRTPAGRPAPPGRTGTPRLGTSASRPVPRADRLIDMAHDHDHDHVSSRGVDDDDFEYEDVDIKEALGLPDALPPIRLQPLPELAADARKAPLAGQLAALATWVGKDGREVDADGDLSEEDQAAAITALGITAEDFDFLWEYALGVEWL